MKDSLVYYSVGALLYCPANKKNIAESIITGRFGRQFSLALCLEDTIGDDFVAEAEQTLCSSLKKIYQAREEKEFYLPKIFVRVRSPRQMQQVHRMFGECMDLVTGFIVPKFSLDNADEYINGISRVNASSRNPVYMMPIYESASMIDLRTRYEILYGLKDKIDRIEDRILNIRVGGNDLCHLYGFRRHAGESIHKIKPVSHIFSDIITVYGPDYVVSGPVYEYFNGDAWEQGLKNEISDDRLCGFTGKTVIHPRQISVVNREYAVEPEDYKCAKSILGWDEKSPSLVHADPGRERMNEYKTHTRWAEKILLLAECYGLKDETPLRIS